MNIPGKEAAAPTPVNSLASGGGLTVGGSVVPSIGMIGEEIEEGANPASLLAHNPELLDMSAFGAMNTGPTLTPKIARRVTALKGVQQEHAKIESEFQLEILALEKKFASRYAPLYARRSAIVAGEAEPTDEEVATGEEAEEDEDFQTVIKDVEEGEDSEKGIPDFWLSALKNHTGIGELITEQDEDALSHLTDIRLSYLDSSPGFKLTFHFSTNDYFTNSELVKTYYYQSEVGYGGDLIYDRAEGSEIAWKEEKDLTKKVEIKKQRNKTTNRTRVIKKVIAADSFFNFFSPPKMPGPDEEVSDEVDYSELDERMELDYTIGEDIKERVIPRAVDFFTGKAGLDLDDDDDDEFDDGEDFDDDLSDEDDNMGGGGGGGGSRGPAPGTSQQEAQECKQQ